MLYVSPIVTILNESSNSELQLSKPVWIAIGGGLLVVAIIACTCVCIMFGIAVVKCRQKRYIHTEIHNVSLKILIL